VRILIVEDDALSVEQLRENLKILEVALMNDEMASISDEPFHRAGVYEWTMERWRFGHV